MMKFKKVLMAVFAIVLCLPAVLLAGCGKDKSLNLERYFEKSVSYNVYNVGSGKGKLSDYTGDEAVQTNQFSRTQFTGISSWLYRMKIEYIEFDIYSTKDVDNFEIFISITNMVNGDETLTSGSRTHITDAIALSLKEGKHIHAKVKIDDIVADNSATTTLAFYLSDTSYFRTNGQDTGFKYSIYNLKIFGEHQK